MEGILAVEMATYKNNREELLKTARGKFVLIKGETIVETFDTETDAIQTGYEKFGNVPFLVKQILEVEIPVRVFAAAIA